MPRSDDFEPAGPQTPEAKVAAEDRFNKRIEDIEAAKDMENDGEE
jgi:hypothetical protein